MGEIIHFDFNKNRKAEKDKEVETKDVKVFSGISKSDIEKLSKASLEGLNGDDVNRFLEENFMNKINSEGLNDSNPNRISENDVFFRKFAHFVLSDDHKKLKNLQIKQGPYDQARDLVSSYTNEELVNWITESHESEWVVRPSFYMAIYNEIKSRLPERYNKL